MQLNRQAVNPYLPSYEYVPDGEPHVFGDRVYIFGSHDKFNGKVYCENDYVCWSAPVSDLSSWSYEGKIYRRSQDPTPVKPMQTHLWAPDVAQGPDGRFYLYYGLEWYNRVGIAVCDTPCGEYQYYGEVTYPDGTRYGGNEGEEIRFDPAVICVGKKTYLYTGFSSDDLQWIAQKMKVRIVAEGNTVVELASDMKTVVSQPKSLLPGKANSSGTGFEGHEFYEASSMRFFEGKYYAVYSSVLSYELCYAVSDYPDRGFIFGGPIHSNGGIVNGSTPLYYWGNNHGSIERIGTKYYVFAHRQTNRSETNRQGIAELIDFENGKFGFAEMTSQGLNDKPLACSGEYEAGIACVLYGKQGAKKITKTGIRDPYITQAGPDREEEPCQYIANMRNGSVCGFKYFEIPKEEMLISLIVKAYWHTRGKIEMSTKPDFSVCETINICKSGIQKLSKKVKMEAGKQTLYFRYSGTGKLDFIKIIFVDCNMKLDT